MKKNIIVVFILILVVWGLAELGKSNQKNQEKQTQSIEIKQTKEGLLADNDVYDFGEISMRDGLVESIFSIKNITNTDIFIEKIASSCMCTTVFLETNNDSEKGPFGMEGMGYLPPANELIKSGETRNVRVVYDPNAHGPAGVGYIERFINLTDDNGNTLELEIKALVRP